MLNECFAQQGKDSAASYTTGRGFMGDPLGGISSDTAVDSGRYAEAHLVKDRANDNNGRVYCRPTNKDVMTDGVLGAVLRMYGKDWGSDSFRKSLLCDSGLFTFDNRGFETAKCGVPIPKAILDTNVNMTEVWFYRYAYDEALLKLFFEQKILSLPSGTSFVQDPLSTAELYWLFEGDFNTVCKISPTSSFVMSIGANNSLSLADPSQQALYNDITKNSGNLRLLYQVDNSGRVVANFYTKSSFNNSNHRISPDKGVFSAKVNGRALENNSWECGDTIAPILENPEYAIAAATNKAQTANPGTGTTPPGTTPPPDSGDVPPPPADSGEVPSPNGDSSSDPCYTNAGALGWLMCPALAGASTLLNNVYSWIKDNFLNVRAGIFDSNDSEGTINNNGTNVNIVPEAWGAIRTIANVIFIILILVVVLSQITGIGIDNYGIKKILPRLIIAAILVNLSYIICQLAVDISNVLGYSIEGYLKQFGVTGEITASYAPGAGQVVGSTLILGVVALGIFLLNPGIILTLLLGILSFLIAALFMWLILVLRQAGVIIGVIISPLAFICYLLPNTNKLFQKWLSLMKALLLVFPLCALVVGGGSMVAKILGEVANSAAPGDAGYGIRLGFSLAAMALQVLPFFLIPTLLKGSLAGLGTLGAKINGLRGGANKWARGKAEPALKNSPLGQNRFTRAAANRQYRKAEASKFRQNEYQRKKAQQYIDKMDGKPVKAGSLEAARLANARSTVAAAEKQNTDIYSDEFKKLGMGTIYSRGAGPGGTDAQGFALDAGGNRIVNLAGADGLQGELAQELAKGDAADAARINALSDRLVAAGGTGIDAMREAFEAAQVAGMTKKSADMLRNNTAIGRNAGAVKTKDQSFFKHLSNSGYLDGSGNFNSGSAISQESFRGLSDEEFAGSSAGEVQRMVNSTLSSGNATEIGALQDKIKGIYGNEKLVQSIDGKHMQAMEQAFTNQVQNVGGVPTVTSTTQAPMSAAQYNADIQAATDRAQQASQTEMLKVAHEQVAQARGIETTGVAAGYYAPPRGFDIATNPITLNGNGEQVITNVDGHVWNLQTGKYES
jgi:hypothetical protein